MKTSNKNIIGSILAVLLLTTTVNSMVYAKYKRGELMCPFSVNRPELMAKIDAPAARFVSLIGFG